MTEQNKYEKLLENEVAKSATEHANIQRLAELTGLAPDQVVRNVKQVETSEYDTFLQSRAIGGGQQLPENSWREVAALLFFCAVFLLAAYMLWRFWRRAALFMVSRLTLPANRAGFALLVACCGAFAVALLMAASDGDGGRFLTRVLDPGERPYDTYDYLGRYSIGGGVLGAWLAWAYEPTFGRLIRWIKKG